jgi:hypothetical protein
MDGPFLIGFLAVRPSVALHSRLADIGCDSAIIGPLSTSYFCSGLTGALLTTYTDFSSPVTDCRILTGGQAWWGAVFVKNTPASRITTG